MPHQSKENRALQDGVFDAVIATEYPVPRSYGSEILAITADAVDLTRFPLPVLVLHEMKQLPIGVARNPTIADGQLRAEVYLSDSEQALRVGKDIADGVLQHVSVGYSIQDTQNGPDGETRVTKWQPHELSVVSVPADPFARISKRGKRQMENKSESRGDVKAVQRNAAEIMELAARHNLTNEGVKALRDGESIEQFRSFVLDQIGSKGALGISFESPLGLTRQEAQQFSFARAITAQATGDWSDASFEQAVLRETRNQTTRSNSFVVPNEILTRDITKTGAPSMVGTDHMASSFIDFLYKQSSVLGRCTVMSGLSGDIAIPRLAGTATAGWYSEQGTITASTPSFDNVVLRPEVLAAMVSYSRKLLAQSQPNVESIVRRDLATVLSLEMERAVINGSGIDNEPTGILNTAGVTSIALGTPDGGQPSWTGLLRLIEAVASANADTGGAFIINSATEAYLRQKQRIAATDSVFVLDSTSGEGIAGREVIVSNNVPSDLTKGAGTDLSAIIYGDLSHVLLGQWGGLEIIVDPYTDLQTSTIRVAAFMHCDIGLRHTEAFAFHPDADVSL